jgi:phenylpropionate dioxygenase-like ring-hydroxylating dioxygenase large terminal subunit
MSRKVSRRHFARTSVAAGAAAAAAALPGTLTGATPVATKIDVPSKAAASGAALAHRRRVAPPVEVAYGGMDSTGRDMMLDTTAYASQSAAPHPSGWREGTTIPAEYYLDDKHYQNDERFIAEHFWLMADHESRIRKPGDYFVFEYGRGESVIIVRDQAGAVKAYHNICRHRGSRLCQHGFDNVHPSEARADAKPVDPRMSVVQLGPSGNTPVFRCPYHAWTYDLTGRLIATGPNPMPEYFNPAQNGLHPCHVRTVEGFIFISLARQDPPDFDAFVGNWRSACEEYKTAGLKVAARRQYPTKGNWKLAVENFRECYHCGPSHTKSYHWVHQMQFVAEMTPGERARVEQELAREGHGIPVLDERRRQDREAAAGRQRGSAGGMGAGNSEQHLRPGYVTGSLDGKPVAPLLPAKKEFTHFTRYAATGFSTSYLQAYDDHVAVARFTPRDIMSTDVEIFWLVNPAAKEKEIDIERMVALWDLTYREDRWIVENNHLGLMNARYTPGYYSTTEGGPASFIKWYMTEVVTAV